MGFSVALVADNFFLNPSFLASLQKASLKFLLAFQGYFLLVGIWFVLYSKGVAGETRRGDAVVCHLGFEQFSI